MKMVQHKFMPEEKFIKLYINCIENIEYKNILELYKYSIKNEYEDIDFNNIRIKLGNKKH